MGTAGTFVDFLLHHHRSRKQSHHHHFNFLINQSSSNKRNKEVALKNYYSSIRTRLVTVSVMLFVKESITPTATKVTATIIIIIIHK
jgi:hypothetical protein